MMCSGPAATAPLTGFTALSFGLPTSIGFSALGLLVSTVIAALDVSDAGGTTTAGATLRVTVTVVVSTGFGSRDFGAADLDRLTSTLGGLLFFALGRS